MYLLDTNVVSELRKTTRADAAVRAWSENTSAGLIWLSTISLLELEIGVLRMERRDVAQGSRLRAWLEQWVLIRFKERLLSVDVAVVRACAKLHVPDPRAERDALIAATALVHGLTVVTRNTADFEPMGVQLLNPWLAPPP
jgi:predicted nucleic acid-binding protein